MIVIVATTTEEIKEAFEWLTANTGADFIVKTSEIQKQKKSDYDKKRYQEKKNSTMEKVKNNREKREEEREEKEEVPPLLPPFPFPTPLSYPPYNPPFPEEKEEREGERKERDRAKSQKPVKNRHGEFGHVLLTPVEYSKICEQFDDADDRIRRLDEYLEMHRNKSYSNHYLTILNWARRDGDKPQEREKTTAEMIAELDWSKYDGSQTV